MAEPYIELPTCPCPYCNKAVERTPPIPLASSLRWLAVLVEAVGPEELSIHCVREGDFSVHFSISRTHGHVSPDGTVYMLSKANKVVGLISDPATIARIKAALGGEA